MAHYKDRDLNLINDAREKLLKAYDHEADWRNDTKTFIDAIIITLDLVLETEDYFRHENTNQK
jgi:hypothetical protein